MRTRLCFLYCTIGVMHRKDCLSVHQSCVAHLQGWREVTGLCIEPEDNPIVRYGRACSHGRAAGYYIRDDFEEFGDVSRRPVAIGIGSVVERYGGAPHVLR